VGVFQVTLYFGISKLDSSDTRMRDVQVVMWAKYIGRDRTREVSTEFFLVGAGSTESSVDESIAEYDLNRPLTGWQRFACVYPK